MKKSELRDIEQLIHVRSRVRWGSNSASPGAESRAFSSHHIQSTCQVCTHSVEAETIGLEIELRQREAKQRVEDPPNRREWTPRAQGPEDPDTGVGIFDPVSTAERAEESVRLRSLTVKDR